MGTRADFYIGRGKLAQWLGSIAYDGYPDDDRLAAIISSTSEAEFKQQVIILLSHREDATIPEMGWPWPWNNSQLTDYSYALDGGKVWISPFGEGWFDSISAAMDSEDVCDKEEFPDMSERAKPARAGSRRSGIMVFGMPTTDTTSGEG